MAAYANKTVICLFVTKNMEMFIGLVLYIRSLIKLIVIDIYVFDLISNFVNENTSDSLI